MGKQINVAVVGCGDIAGYSAAFSHLIPEMRLAACCDPILERAQNFARWHRIGKVFTDYKEMLASPGLDAVYLAVPHFLHSEMILAAVEAKLAVLVEKPLTRTYTEGLAVVQRIRQAGVKVGVNYQYRYDPGCYALAQAVRSGVLGKVFSVNILVPWRRDAAYFDKAPWHKTIAQAGGGTLITQASHFLDIGLWALGDQPVSAMGRTSSPKFDVEVDTLTHGIIETSRGTLVAISATMAAAVERPVRMEVFGESGTAIYTNKPFSQVRFEGVRVKKERRPQPGLHALQSSLAAFCGWVSGGREYLSPAESTLPVLAAVDGIYRSAQIGERVTIKLE